MFKVLNLTVQIKFLCANIHTVIWIIKKKNKAIHNLWKELIGSYYFGTKSITNNRNLSVTYKNKYTLANCPNVVLVLYKLHW
jgi:branched-subunit amino acid transport protein